MTNASKPPARTTPRRGQVSALTEDSIKRAPPVADLPYQTKRLNKTSLLVALCAWSDSRPDSNSNSPSRRTVRAGGRSRSRSGTTRWSCSRTQTANEFIDATRNLIPNQANFLERLILRIIDRPVDSRRTGDER